VGRTLQGVLKPTNPVKIPTTILAFKDR